MLYQVIGVGRKVGEFTPRDNPNQDIHYDNTVFHVVGLKKTIGVTGQIAEQLSIKTVDVGEIVEASAVRLNRPLAVSSISRPATATRFARGSWLSNAPRSTRERPAATM